MPVLELNSKLNHVENLENENVDKQEDSDKLVMATRAKVADKAGSAAKSLNLVEQ